MRRAVFLSLLVAGCGGEVITASAGGTVSSEDGVLTLVLPPGALPDDTAISIEPIDEPAWPVDAPGRFERPAPVYQIEPMGTELVADAYVIFRPTDRSLLSNADGHSVPAVHYSWGSSDAKVRPAAHSRTIFMADGRVAVVATVFELGVHWIGERVPGADRTLPQLSLDIDADFEGAQPLDSPFHVGRMALRSDMPHALFGREVFAAAAGPAGSSVVQPVRWSDGMIRTWDATADADLLLHPFEIFDELEGPREETVTSFEDTQPIMLEDGMALDPIIDPLPGWRCDAAGDSGSVFVGVDVITGASEGVARVGVTRELTAGDCR